MAALSLVTAVTLAAVGNPTPPPVSDKVQQAYENGATATPTAAKVKTVAFLGDSYTAVEGRDPKDNYVGILSMTEGWKPVPLGQGGTGYTNAGDPAQGKSVFLARVPKVIAAKPDIVIVQGSTNDHGASADTEAAAKEVYAAIHRGLPKATIIAIGPLSPPDAIPAEVAQTRAGLIAATKAAGVRFIDPTAEKWLQPTDGLFVDGFHPNLTGHRKLSELLATDLAALGIG